MIFVTLGTQEIPFPRLLDLVSRLSPEHEVFVQYGCTPLPPNFGPSAKAFLSPTEYDVQLRTCNLVITHCGVGSVLSALRAGKSTVVVPRLGQFGEHVDDHQLELAEKFARLGYVYHNRPTDNLADTVRQALAVTRQRPSRGNEDVIDYLRAWIESQLGSSTLKHK